MIGDERRDGDGDGGIEALVVACIDAVEESGPDVIEEFCRRHPAHAEVLRRRLATLLDAGLLEEPAADEARLPESFGEYRVVGRLGGGGMGVVYRAIQDRLDRDVAVKTIRPELLHFADARTRFAREVAALARLSHPGIVPVFGSGEQDGVPWFAMEHVAGAPLSRVLDELSGRDPAALTGADLRRALTAAAGADAAADAQLFGLTWTEACLQIGREVAVALDHAHRAGILHRDVKPSNVLLGLDGRARLFDFGLARPDAAREEVGELTRTGAMVGSLPYMAPEQVRGETIDRRTDVYGLAATLVELLTLAPPFGERAQEQLRSAILDAPRPRLQSRNRALPRDLLVVLDKALAVAPRDRYATAAEFARDLEAVVELRPVAARPAGPLLRLHRWARRRPAMAVAVAALGVVLLAAPIVLAVVNARISAALARAEARFDDAFDSIVHLSATVADEGMRDLPGAGPLRRDVMMRSLTLFDRLVQDRPDDGQVLLQRALMQRQTATVLAQLGEADAAKEMLAVAEGFLRDWMERSPDDALTAYDLADLLIDRSTGVPVEEALPILEEAERWLDVAADGGRSEADVRTARRQALHNHAFHLEDAGQLADAQRYAQMACDEAARLLAAAPADDPRGRLGVGASHGMLAGLLLEAGRVDEARREFDAAERALAALVDDDPRPEHRFRLGVVRTNDAHRALADSDPVHAEQRARSAVELFEGLCQEQPWRTSYRQRLAMAYDVTGGSLLRQDRAADAIPWMARSVREMDALAAASPGDARVAMRTAIAHHNLAASMVELGRRGDARAHTAAAVDALARLADSYPKSSAGRIWSLARLLDVRARLGDGPPPAADDLARIVRERAAPDAEAWFQLAECAGDAASFVDDVEPFAALAQRALEAAVEAGFDQGERVDGSKYFDVVRTREGFAALRARMR